MSEYQDEIYNDVVMVDDTYYFLQDGPLLEDPMVREINQLLEVERDEVQKMMEGVEK